MSPETFKTWRKSLGLKQKEAADKLGLKKRVIQYYEKGHRDGKTVEIPKNVELACVALALGYDEYDGSVMLSGPASAGSDADTSEPSDSAGEP